MNSGTREAYPMCIANKQQNGQNNSGGNEFSDNTRECGSTKTENGMRQPICLFSVCERYLYCVDVDTTKLYRIVTVGVFVISLADTVM